MSVPDDERQGVEPESQAESASPEATDDSFLGGLGGCGCASIAFAVLFFIVALLNLVYVTHQGGSWDDHAKAACQKVEAIREHSKTECNPGVTCWVDWSDSLIRDEMTAAVAEAGQSTLPGLAKAANNGGFAAVEDWCD